MAQLKASNLAKSYRGRDVIHDVSLAVDSGQIVGLLGPNGAGKTTCFYMIIGIIPADKGSITVNGADITGLNMHQRARRGIGYLPQEASIFRKLTVGDNILAILQTRRDLNKTATPRTSGSAAGRVQCATSARQPRPGPVGRGKAAY